MVLGNFKLDSCTTVEMSYVPFNDLNVDRDNREIFEIWWLRNHAMY